MTKVYIAPGAFHNYVHQMFKRQGYQPVKLDDAEALVLVGGDDINPKLYGERPLRGTYYDDRNDDRDISLAKEFWDRPKIGICRGGQLLNVLSGGGMWQDVNGHGSEHLATDVKTGKLVLLSSIHHQMMIPDFQRGQGLVLTTSKVSTTRKKENLTSNAPEAFEDIEAIFYGSTKSLCFQPHPEIGPPECEEYFFSLIHEHLKI